MRPHNPDSPWRFAAPKQRGRHHSLVWPDVLARWHNASDIALKFAVRKTERHVHRLLQQFRREAIS